MSATTPPTDNLVPRTDREQAAYREGVADGRAYAARDSAPTAEPAREGWQLVPTVPTDRMLTELFRGYTTREQAYAAMLAAAKAGAA